MCDGGGESGGEGSMGFSPEGWSKGVDAEAGRSGDQFSDIGDAKSLAETHGPGSVDIQGAIDQGMFGTDPDYARDLAEKGYSTWGVGLYGADDIGLTRAVDEPTYDLALASYLGEIDTPANLQRMNLEQAARRGDKTIDLWGQTWSPAALAKGMNDKALANAITYGVTALGGPMALGQGMVGHVTGAFDGLGRGLGLTSGPAESPTAPVESLLGTPSQFDRFQSEVSALGPSYENLTGRQTPENTGPAWALHPSVYEVANVPRGKEDVWSSTRYPYQTDPSVEDAEAASYGTPVGGGTDYSFMPPDEPLYLGPRGGDDVVETFADHPGPFPVSSSVPETETPFDENRFQAILDRILGSRQQPGPRVGLPLADAEAISRAHERPAQNPMDWAESWRNSLWNYLPGLGLKTPSAAENYARENANLLGKTQDAGAIRKRGKQDESDLYAGYPSIYPFVAPPTEREVYTPYADVSRWNYPQVAPNEFRLTDAEIATGRADDQRTAVPPRPFTRITPEQATIEDMKGADFFYVNPSITPAAEAPPLPGPFPPQSRPTLGRTGLLSPDLSPAATARDTLTDADKAAVPRALLASNETPTESLRSVLDNIKKTGTLMNPQTRKYIREKVLNLSLPPDHPAVRAMINAKTPSELLSASKIWKPLDSAARGKENYVHVVARD